MSEIADTALTGALWVVAVLGCLAWVAHHILEAL